MAASLPPLPSLDELAAYLVALEPDDAAGVDRLRHAMRALTSHLDVPVTVRVLLDEAVQALDAAAATGAAADALDVVGRRLEEAMAVPASAPVARAVAAPVAPPVAVAAPAAPAATTSASSEAAMPEDEPLPDDADRDLLADFITESRDTLQAAETALLQLEGDPEHGEAINTVFRTFHTIKGTAAFLGLQRASEFAHHAESLLSRVRDREIPYSPRVADLSLKSADLLKEILEGCEQGLATGRLPIPRGYASLMHQVMALVEMTAEDVAVADDHPSTPVPVAPATPVAEVATSAPVTEPGTAVATPVVVAAAPVVAAQLAAAPVAAKAPAAADAKRSGTGDATSVDATVRVRTEKLDLLIDMVGELVIAQSLIAGDQALATSGNHDLVRKTAHAGKIVRELQDLSMSMRMVPLKATFQKMNRLVRDVSMKAGKPIEFVTAGEETEIDRNMVDVIGDPLVHMLRNAIDHGVEAPAERERAGKPRTGVVSLAATHAGGNVVVTLKDDGKGLARDRIVAKAIEKGLISSDAGMTDAEVYNLIFAPGFSTADKVTDLSGRGVGMDVVKRHIESLRGRVEIDSVPGQGTTFTLKLPLTLAITDGMIVRVGQERYIVPTHHIHMSFRPEASQVSTVTGTGEVVLLRGELMPVVRLHRLYDVTGAAEVPTDGLLMIVGDDERRSALLVDELLGQQQVVVKSLGSGLGKIQGVSGGAILGDGRVGLILDVKEILALYRGDEPVHAAA
ncbi:MAG: chemotaxis protein CheA [Gemmatimonadaceae bacterium]|nr:chemotaxis protein CheA [Gemmatimonadaceae bacterium]